MRGASIHLRAMGSPGAAMIHNLRLWSDEHPEPAYLLPQEHRLGHWVEVDGDVAEAIGAKAHLISHQARARQGYSQIWEGVLNLAHPTGLGDRERNGAQIRAFVAGYERITGHRVVQAVVHLDEGRIEAGQPIYNAHAHILIDRTDARGRIIPLSRTQLRQVQDLAAEVTGLERGEDARQTRRRHLPHQAWRGLAQAGVARATEDRERDAAQVAAAVASARQEGREAGLAHGRREAQAEAEQEIKRAEIRGREAGLAQGRAEAQAAAALAEADTAAMYRRVRELLTSSGQARQVDYQEAKRNKDNEEWLVSTITRLTRTIDEKNKQIQAREQTLARVVTAAGADATGYRMDQPEPIVALIERIVEAALEATMPTAPVQRPAPAPTKPHPDHAPAAIQPLYVQDGKEAMAAARKAVAAMSPEQRKARQVITRVLLGQYGPGSPERTMLERGLQALTEYGQENFKKPPPRDPGRER